jgi:hypothetical protein
VHHRASGVCRSTPGVLAPVRVIVSRSIITYSTPCAPLAGTARLHRIAAYTRCPRCVPKLRHLGDLRVVPCFRWPTVSTCRPLRPREAHRLHPSSSFTDDAGLRLSVRVSGAPNLPHPPIPVGRPFRGLTTVRFRCDLSICSPSCRSRPGFHPAHEDFYARASGGLVTLTAAGYNYGVNWTSSTGGTFTR